MGIPRQHPVLMEDTAQDFFLKFGELSSDLDLEVRNNTKERYLSYIFPSKSENKHNK